MQVQALEALEPELMVYRHSDIWCVYGDWDIIVSRWLSERIWHVVSHMTSASNIGIPTETNWPCYKIISEIATR